MGTLVLKSSILSAMKSLSHEKQIINYIKNILPTDSLTPIMELIILKTLEVKSYPEISDCSSYDSSYIRRVASETWQFLSDKLGQKINKKNALITLSEIAISTVSQFVDEEQILDLGTAPVLEAFYGRKPEIIEIHKLIFEQNCRLITLLGYGGIGKTTLSVKLTEEFQDEFPVIIWRSLRNAPPLDLLLKDIIAVLSANQELEGSIELLLKYFKSHHCLLIIDNIETILQSGKVGKYKSGYEDYGTLFRFVGESEHQSCLLLTSRENPPEVNILEKTNLQVKTLLVKGSPEAAIAILKDKRIAGSEAEIGTLANQYDNSPLALKIVATSIQELFAGNLSLFFEQDTTVFNGVRRLLDEHFTRLNPLEIKVINWLVINREWTTLAELEKDIYPPVQRFKILSAIESLLWRSLIEQKEGSYSLQPVVMEYFTDNLISKMCEEFVSLDFEAFVNYSLTKTTVKDYLRQTQQNLLVEPLARLIQDTFSLKRAMKQQLEKVLAKFRTLPMMFYGAGNFIDLCRTLEIDLQNYDLSELSIWQTDLSHVSLENVNFTDCDFKNVHFLQPLGELRCLAYDKTGNLVATGDSHKLIHLWRVNDLQLQHLLIGNSGSIESLSFSHNGEYLFTGSFDRTVKQWLVETGKLQSSLNGFHHGIKNLSLSADEQTLLTLESNGIIKLWDTENQECFHCFGEQEKRFDVALLHPRGKILATVSVSLISIWDLKTGKCLKNLIGHRDIISLLEFSPDGNILISGSQGECLIFWDWQTGNRIKTLSGYSNQLTCLSWQPVNLNNSYQKPLLVTGGGNGSIYFWKLEQGKEVFFCHKVTINKGAILSLSWHPDGQMLGVGFTDNTIQIWDSYNFRCIQTLPCHTNCLHGFDWTPDGKYLTVGGQGNIIKLWEFKTNKWVQEIELSTITVMRLHWSSDGDFLAIGTLDCQAYIWEKATNQLRQIYQGKNTWLVALAWSKDNRFIAFNGDDKVFYLYDTQTQTISKSYQGHKMTVICLAFTHDGQRIVSGGEDEDIKIWDLATQKCLKTLSGHQGMVARIAITEDDLILGSVGFDCTTRLWNLLTGECLQVLTVPRPYENMELTGATGLTDSQTDALMRLGAIKK